MPDRSDAEYWQAVRDRAASLGSDGCTGVSEWHHECCLLHDVLYRDGRDLDGQPVTRSQADRMYWRCMTDRAKWGKWNPRAAVRFLGVSLFRLLKTCK